MAFSKEDRSFRHASVDLPVSRYPRYPQLTVRDYRHIAGKKVLEHPPRRSNDDGFFYCMDTKKERVSPPTSHARRKKADGFGM